MHNKFLHFRYDTIITHQKLTYCNLLLYDVFCYQINHQHARITAGPDGLTATTHLIDVIVRLSTISEKKTQEKYVKHQLAFRPDQLERNSCTIPTYGISESVLPMDLLVGTVNIMLAKITKFDFVVLMQVLIDELQAML